MQSRGAIINRSKAMTLPPRKRAADLRKVLENERRAYERRFPANGHGITFCGQGISEGAFLKLDRPKSGAWRANGRTNIPREGSE
jgi:hypothetical protein